MDTEDSASIFDRSNIASSPTRRQGSTVLGVCVLPYRDPELIKKTDMMGSATSSFYHFPIAVVGSLNPSSGTIVVALAPGAGGVSLAGSPTMMKEIVSSIRIMYTPFCHGGRSSTAPDPE